jgi:hypothetical protein
VTKERDLAFEALAAVTGTDWNVGRGQLNAALKLIREQCDLEGEDLAAEIEARAQMYRQVMPGIMLTPPALAKHWLRVAYVPTPKVKPYVSTLPPRDHEGNLERAREAMDTLWGGKR